MDSELYYIPSKDFTWTEYKQLVTVIAKINKGKYMQIKGIPKSRVMTKRESLEYEKGFDLFKEYFYSLWN